MIKWCKNLYLDEEVGKKPKKWIKRVEKERPAYDLYCVCLPSNPENLFDIINVNELLFRYYRRRGIVIAGLAKSRYGAETLVMEIVEDMLRTTGELRVKEYFGLDEKD
jgi:hypothetical protein